MWYETCRRFLVVVFAVLLGGVGPASAQEAPVTDPAKSSSTRRGAPVLMRVANLAPLRCVCAPGIVEALASPEKRARSEQARPGGGASTRPRRPAGGTEARPGPEGGPTKGRRRPPGGDRARPPRPRENEVARAVGDEVAETLGADSGRQPPARSKQGVGSSRGGGEGLGLIVGIRGGRQFPCVCRAVPEKSRESAEAAETDDAEAVDVTEGSEFAEDSEMVEDEMWEDLEAWEASEQAEGDDDSPE